MEIEGSRGQAVDGDEDLVILSSPAICMSFSFILRGMAGGSTRSLSAALIFSVEDLPH